MIVSARLIWSWAVIGFSTLGLTSARYEPNWDSLDTRPIPSWYDEAKFGIFIHWGLFSVPAYGSEWFWFAWKSSKIPAYERFMNKNYPKNFTYPEFAPKFRAEFYEPNIWANIILASGAKYMVLTSKHHEGYTLWPSKVSPNWNVKDVGPKRDVIAELAREIRKKKVIRFGLYHSLCEWYNPLYLEDEKNEFKTRKFPKSKVLPALYEIVNAYKPDVLWSDGDSGDDVYWGSQEFLAWLYNDSPVKDTVVTNDRWGSSRNKHGDFFTVNDRFNPGHILDHKWENAMTIDRGVWGYRRDVYLETFLTIEELIRELVTTVSCGGNLLMNIAPTADGRIVPIFEERLRQVGSWLDLNGESIFNTKPWVRANDSLTEDVWYTSRRTIYGTKEVYAILLKWPEEEHLTLASVEATEMTDIKLLGYPTVISYTTRVDEGLTINVPLIPFHKMPCQWAWVFKISNVWE